MVKTQSSRQIPLAKIYLILHIGRRLHVPFMVCKVKLLPCMRIELSRVSDGVVQSFTNWVKDAVGAQFPFMSTVMSGEISTCITLTVTTVLRDYDWRGQRIGRQVCSCIPYAASEAQ